MSEVAAAPKSKYWNEEKKKFTITTQFKDKEGNPVGAIQYFEADTLDELLEKKDAAQESAAVRLYEVKKQNKLGKMLEPDKASPILTFEERLLTAEERVELGKKLVNPATAYEAHKILMEAQLGAPMETYRAKMRDLEIKTRVEAIQDAVSEFKVKHPEFVESESNRDNIKKYMEKNDLDWTVNNLEIAFDDLVKDDLLTLRAPKAAVPEPVVPTAAAPTEPAVIPPAPTTQTPAIPAVSAEVRPKQSSSGLGRDNSSATPGTNAPKVIGITNRDINNMSSVAYEKALREGIPERNISASEFVAFVNKLTRG